MSELEIKEFAPSQVLAEIEKPDSRIVRLMAAGYNLSANARENLLATVRQEYSLPENLTHIFLARVGSEVVGSLTLTEWQDDATDKRGKDFFTRLRQLNPSLAAKLKQHPVAICTIVGRVVNPEYRSQGVGGQLLTRAVETLQPMIIESQTQSVGAVMSSLKLVNQGYRIFYGATEITPDQPNPHTGDHLAIHSADRFARRVDLDPDSAVHILEGGISPILPDTSEAPAIIAKAFEPVVQAQLEAYTDETALAILLAIKKELLA